MLESSIYPFVPGEYGINFQAIPLGANDLPIKGGSGRDLKVILTEPFILISDTKAPSLLLNAALYPSDNRLMLGLRTHQPRTGMRHPDFFAKRFIYFALSHFKQHGYEIKHFSALWQKSSRNYREFRRGVRAGLGEKEAAASTWSGQVMTGLGFNQVYNIDSSNGRVVATFSKE